MLSAQARLELYKAEREHLGDELFGGENFPVFADWNRAYIIDFKTNHVTVTTKEADEIMDKVVEEAELELAGAVVESHQDAIKGLGAEATPGDQKNATAVALDKPRPIVRAARAKGPAKSGKVKKSDIARKVIAENKERGREEMLNLLMAKAKLTRQAANTYLYKYSK